MTMMSKRNYVTILLIMSVVFVLFLFQGVAKEQWNDYADNAYADNALPEGQGGSDADRTDQAKRGVVVYIGEAETDRFGCTVTEWCAYTKQVLEEYTSLADWTGAAFGQQARVVLVNPDYLDFSSDANRLAEIALDGTPVVFCDLPEYDEIAGNLSLRKLLGIRMLRAESCGMDGIRLFAGFLLGGDVNYYVHNEDEEEQQDMDLEVPWYQLSAGGKVYMAGILGTEEDVAEEDPPALIWSTSQGGARVFAVNGDYLTDISGIGILTAMMAETESYLLYPVVNAQTFVLADCPDLASENEEQMQAIYSRSSEQVLRDLVFPALMALGEKTGFRLSCMTGYKLDDGDEAGPNLELMTYYLKWLNEEGGEMGISLTGNAASRDEAYWRADGVSYPFTSLYAEYGGLEETAELLDGGNGMLSKVHTVVARNPRSAKLFDYLTDSVTLQSATEDGFVHTFSDDFRLRAMETALGYSGILVDMREVLFPGEDADHWELLSDDLASNLDTYWEPFAAFDRVVASECDLRIRQLLALDDSCEREGDALLMEVENLDACAWFILRTHGETIADAENATWEKIEEDAYLVKVTDAHARLTLEDTDQLYYYDK